MTDQQLNYEKVFSVLSLFSGGGLLDLGFMNRGFQIEKALEINEQFIRGYNFALGNYAHSTDNNFWVKGLVVHKTINEQTDASNKKIQQGIGREFNGIIGLIGGPPCQDYSVGGQNKGVEGERGKLIYSYLRLVQLTRPKFLFFENVEGLYRTKSHRIGFLNLLERLEELGYGLWYDIINPLTYGFPQDRPRIIVVGFQKEIIRKLKKAGFNDSKDNELLKKTDDDDFVFKWPKIVFSDPKTSISWPTKWEFLCSRFDENSIQIPEKFRVLQVQSAFQGITDETPNQMDRFKPKSDKFWRIPEGDTFRKSFKRLHRYRFSPTVAYGNNEVHLHPTEPRRLSVREALRLQTVPDEYVLPRELSLSAKFKMISNGVPTRQAELIATEIRKTLLRYCELTGEEF